MRTTMKGYFIVVILFFFETLSLLEMYKNLFRFIIVLRIILILVEHRENEDFGLFFFCLNLRKQELLFIDRGTTIQTKLARKELQDK